MTVRYENAKLSPVIRTPGCYYACVACMQPVCVWTSTKNVWNTQNALELRAFVPPITRNLITRVLTICRAKLTQSTTPRQKCFDLRSLSPALRNLWLSLYLKINQALQYIGTLRWRMAAAGKTSLKIIGNSRFSIFIAIIPTRLLC